MRGKPGIETIRAKRRKRKDGRKGKEIGRKKGERKRGWGLWTWKKKERIQQKRTREKRMEETNQERSM